MYNLDGNKILHLFMVLFYDALILDCILLSSRIVKELLKYLNITSYLLVGKDCWYYMDCSKHLTCSLEAS